MDKLTPFVTTLDKEVSFATMVDRVTIRFSHPLLENGIEFIDLPGNCESLSIYTSKRIFRKDGATLINLVLIMMSKFRILVMLRSCWLTPFELPTIKVSSIEFVAPSFSTMAATSKL
jgi:hypothetical protein